MLQKPDPGISATPHENNLRYFNVVIAGPQDSAYDGAPVMMEKDLHLPCRHLGKWHCSVIALGAGLLTRQEKLRCAFGF